MYAAWLSLEVKLSELQDMFNFLCLYVKSLCKNLCKYLCISMMLDIKSDKKKWIHFCLPCFLYFVNLQFLIAWPPESFLSQTIAVVLLLLWTKLLSWFCRLRAEQERLDRIGPIAYYSEWVKAWKRDTSHEAVQKHFEETGEDENTQLIEMFCHQTDREYRIMMGTDVRLRRDPLAMRMREDQIKQSIYSKANTFVCYFYVFTF